LRFYILHFDFHKDTLPLVEREGNLPPTNEATSMGDALTRISLTVAKKNQTAYKNLANAAHSWRRLLFRLIMQKTAQILKYFQ
jgi:hypothetical protein